MKLKPDKYSFMLQEVEYLGHKISEKGLQLAPEKVQVIDDVPPPKYVTQTQVILRNT